MGADDHMTAGRAQTAMRLRIHPGQQLRTPSQAATIEVGRIDEHGVTMLLGEKATPTRLCWECWEGVLTFLAGKGWVEIGGRFDVAADPKTLDGYLKTHTKRATAGWVAAVMEAAELVEIDRGRPARVRVCVKAI